MARDRNLLAVFKSAAAPLKDRAAALGGALRQAAEDGSVIPTLIDVVRDAAEPEELRQATLRALQAAAFSVPEFDSFRKDYVTALREVGGDGSAVRLQQQALDILALHQDAPTQKKLLAGLAEPAAALVPPETALQLLAYDAHAGAEAAAEKIVKNPPNLKAKLQALRLLAADAASAPMMEKFLRDKGEDTEVRKLCAAALNVLKPRKLLDYAREIVLDEADTDPDINALSLTALTNFGDAAKLAADDVLHATVGRLKTEASAKVKKVAREFLKKYAE